MRCSSRRSFGGRRGSFLSYISSSSYFLFSRARFMPPLIFWRLLLYDILAQPMVRTAGLSHSLPPWRDSVYSIVACGEAPSAVAPTPLSSDSTAKGFIPRSHEQGGCTNIYVYIYIVLSLLPLWAIWRERERENILSLPYIYSLLAGSKAPQHSSAHIHTHTQQNRTSNDGGSY